MKRNPEIQDEIKQIAPGLQKLEHRQNFKVPEGYFDGLSDEILRKVRTADGPVEAKPTAPQKSWLDVLAGQLAALLQPRMAMQLAAIALLIAAAVWIWQRPATDTSPALATTDASELDAQEVGNYIAAHIDEFDTDLLYEMVLAKDEITDAGEGLLDDVELDDQMIDDILEDLDVNELNDLL